MEQNNGNFSMDDMHKLARSPAGRQLMAMLATNHSDAAKAVRSSMASGDTQQAKNALADFLADPKVQALLRQLEEKNG